MIIPPGYTEAEVLEIIQTIGKSLSRKYKFDIYDESDIESECFILALEGLEKYDGRAPLKNFLSVHIRNRLKNLRRNYMSVSAERHRILAASSLDMEPPSNIGDILTKLENQELRDLLNRAIPPELRPDFLRLCDGYTLSHHRKKLVIDTIRELVKAHGY